MTSTLDTLFYVSIIFSQGSGLVICCGVIGLETSAFPGVPLWGLQYKTVSVSLLFNDIGMFLNNLL